MLMTQNVKECKERFAYSSDIFVVKTVFRTCSYTNVYWESLELWTPCINKYSKGWKNMLFKFRGGSQLSPHTNLQMDNLSIITWRVEGRLDPLPSKIFCQVFMKENHSNNFGLANYFQWQLVSWIFWKKTETNKKCIFTWFLIWK